MDEEGGEELNWVGALLSGFFPLWRFSVIGSVQEGFSFSFLSPVPTAVGRASGSRI